MAFFVARVAMLVALLGVPILGTSYALVSTVTSNVNDASEEHRNLVAFAGVIDLTAAVEAVRRDLVDRRRAASRIDRARVDALLARSRGAYRDSAPAIAFWRGWSVRWTSFERRPSLSHARTILGDLGEIGNDLYSTTPLDTDPDFTIQNLAAVMLRWSPRFLVAIRRSADAVASTPGERLSPQSIETVATAHALERHPQERVFSDLETALEIDPVLRPRLGPVVHDARLETRRFDDRIDVILDSFRKSPHDGVETERAARAAFDAHVGLWREMERAADRLVLERRAGGIVKRRSIVVLSLLAVLLGTLAVTISIRSMARRDRIEIASAKLESDTLRAELRRANVERALRLQAAQFQNVFENADLGIAVFEPSGVVREFNPALRRMLGERMAGVLGARYADVISFASERHPFTVEELHANHDGSPQWLELTFSGVYDDGLCQMVILLGRDVTESKLFEQSLLHEANHDALTRIPNRAAFERDLAAACEDVGSPFAIFYVDLDKFKAINDGFGHAAGDAVLIATAERLRRSLGTDDLCARLGGDEFAAIVRGAHEGAVLERIAARIANAIAKPIDYEGTSLGVSASIGIAEHRKGERCCSNLKRQADEALYAAKERGGDGYRHRDPSESLASDAPRRLLVSRSAD